MQVLAVLLFGVVILNCHFIVPVQAQPCGDSTNCLGKALGAACVTGDSRSQTISCGTCTTQNGCGTVCVASASQASCNAGPSCTKAATGAGGFGVATPCGSTRIIRGDTLVEPTTFSSSNGRLNLTLSAQLTTWNATAFTITTRQMCPTSASGASVATCSSPAPMMRVKPGDILSITLKNNLPADTTSSVAMNVLRLANTVNLHTHGLHVDPTIDNVMETVASGGSMTYNFPVVADHLPGTHWYHSHAHGSSALHMLGGMAGVIIVDPSPTFALPASYTAMASTVLQLTHIPMCSCNPTADPFSLKSYPYIQMRAGDNNAFHNFQQNAGYTETQIMLTNGQYQPRTTLAPGEWRRFEVVNAVGDVYVELEVRSGGVGSNGVAACSMLVLAMDGIFLFNGPRAATYVLLSIAGRASIAVMCPTAGTYYLQSYPQQRAADYEANFQQNLLTLEVTGQAVVMTQPTWTSTSFTRPYYLRDLTSTAATTTFEVGVEQTGVTSPADNWLGVGKNCTLAAAGRADLQAANPNTYGQCAYQPFDHLGSYRFAAPACSVIDMVINGRGRTPHPIHLHVHPFQIVSMAGDNGGDSWTGKWGQVGEWRDTAPALAGRMLVRFRADAFQGPIMIHCHFLLHEDMGMMDRWWTGAPNLTPCVATSTSAACNASVPSTAFAMSFASATVDCQNLNVAATTTVAGATPTTTSAPVAGSSTTLAGATPGPTTTTVAPPPTPVSSTTTSTPRLGGAGAFWHSAALMATILVFIICLVM